MHQSTVDHLLCPAENCHKYF